MENLSAGLWSPVSGGVSCAGFPGGLWDCVVVVSVEIVTWVVSIEDIG